MSEPQPCDQFVTFERADDVIVARFHGRRNWHLCAHGATIGAALVNLAEVVKVAEEMEADRAAEAV